jgi:hypothetical protein
LSHSAFTGISRHHLGRLVAELASPWQARRESALRQRRGAGRRRAGGAGRRHELVFTDRVLVTLAVLRLQIPHAALAAMFGIDRSTVTRAVHEIRPLLAGRGYATPQGRRLSTLADVFACAAAHGIRLRIDGSEIQVRRPPAHRPGRRALVPGKKKMNTIKFTKVSDERGRTLWDRTFRPGRQHDQRLRRPIPGPGRRPRRFVAPAARRSSRKHPARCRLWRAASPLPGPGKSDHRWSSMPGTGAPELPRSCSTGASAPDNARSTRSSCLMASDHSLNGASCHVSAEPVTWDTAGRRLAPSPDALPCA